MSTDDDNNREIGRTFGRVEFNDKDTGGSRDGVFWRKAVVRGNLLVSHGEGFNVWNAYIKER